MKKNKVIRKADILLFCALMAAAVLLLIGPIALTDGSGNRDAAAETSGDENPDGGEERPVSAVGSGSVNENGADSAGNAAEQNGRREKDAGSGYQVVVRQDGKTAGIYPLDENREIVLKDDGRFNKIVIQNDEVFMEESSCENQICVEEGRIHERGQSIICLPNRVVVEITAAASGTEESTDGDSNAESSRPEGSGSDELSSDSDRVRTGSGQQPDGNANAADEGGVDAIAR